MKPKGIKLERTLYNQQQDLLLQQLFTASHVSESLVGVVRSFQEERIAQGIENKLHFKESVVERCEIQIGTLHLDLKAPEAEKVKKCLEASEQAVQVVRKDEQASGQIDWQFTGVNQFGAITIRVKERRWQVEFSRLQRHISSLITDEATLRPKAHQDLYEEMKKTLQPLAPSVPSEIVILQGASGLGKSHCTEYYFYHEANKRHQMVAWFSGESEESFLRDWEALADQLRSIDTKRKEDSDTTLIRHWCEEQLGQWLFIVDNAQVEIEWLKQYLPQKGGHVLITTTQPPYCLPQGAKILSFSPLSSEDSELLLKAWLGKYWEAAGFQKEAQALCYFSEALGGSPALLTQIALMVRKKGLSFERLMEQFQDAKTRSLLLGDTVFDQLKGQTFLECVKKSWRQWIISLGNHYPQLSAQEHEAHLKQFIGFLKQEVEQALEKTPQIYVDEELIMAYWQGVWISLSCTPLDTGRMSTCLNLLPFSYDKTNQRWAVSLAGLHALEWQSSAKDLSSSLPEVPAISLVTKEKPDLPQMPSGVNLAISLENSSLGYADIDLLTNAKPAELTTWRLPTTNPYFIPRRQLTAEIADKLPHKTTRERSTELVLAAASGMGGIGKTELARHFITEPLLSSHYQRRFWFNAVSIATLRNEFHDFASYLGLIKPKEYIEDKILIHRLHGWFNLNAGWLMILDNADEYNTIAHWIPKEGGAVLITTREPNPGTLKDKQIVKVPLLTVEEAVIWLYRLALRDQNTATQTEQEAARELVENLGYLPLAIAQSAAYLREQKEVSIEEYQKNFLELLMRDESLVERNELIDKKSDAYSRRVIASTWMLSLERIEASAKEKGLFNACPWLLTACSYLASKDIPLGLLECWFKAICDERKGISSQSIRYFLDEYIAQLLRYSLCERSGLTSMISMHELVQEVLRSDLTIPLPTGQKTSPEKIIYLGGVKKVVFLSLSTTLISYSTEFYPSIADRKRRIDLISHLQKIIAAWEMPSRQSEIIPGISTDILISLYERLAEVQLDLRAGAKEALILYQKQLDLGQTKYGLKHFRVASTLANLGAAYGALGDAQQQKSLVERALPIAVQYYGPEHPETARMLTLLSNAYCALGDTQQQQRLLERVLGINERYYGPQCPEVAITLTSLGVAYGALGDAQQQKSLLERALPILEHHYGSKHPKVAGTLINLGNAYGDWGDMRQKKCLLERALGINERYYGPEHPNVANTLANLGDAYGALGDAQQQKNLLERALRIDECYYGIEHPNVAKTLMSLGNAYGDLGDAQQQKSLLERALPILEQYYGPEHREVAKTLLNLSNAYSDLGDVQQQKSLLEKALRINERYYGSEHPEVAKMLASLGNAYGALGDAQQKKTLLQRALPIFEQHYGLEHPEVAKTLANLSIAYGALGDAQQKKCLLERALPILEQHYGPEHPNVASTLVSLGNAYGDLGEIKQQKSLLERALPIIECYYGHEHPEVASTLANLGVAYGTLGDAQQQKSLLQRALRINERYYGPEHPNVAKTLASLGNAYGALGNAQQQKSLLQRALPILDRYYGPEHPEVASTLANLGNAYGALGDSQQQKSLLEKTLPILEQYYGPEHPNVASTLLNLGNAYGDLGDAQQKKNLLERSVLIFEQHYGSEHPVVAKTLTNLGTAYGAVGDVQQQKSLLERALRLKEGYYGPEHPEVVNTLTNLSSAYSALGDAQQQKSLLEKALRIGEQHHGPEHPIVATILMNLGVAHGDLGDAQQQKTLLERALRIKERYYGPEHPEVAAVLMNLGTAYGHLGDVQQKKSLLQRALPIFEQHYGLEHPEVAKVLTNLGNAYGALGDQQQKSLLERALRIDERYYGTEHFEVAKTLASLGKAYGALGDVQQQKRILDRVLPIFEHHYGPEHPEVAKVLTNLGIAYGALGDSQQKKKFLESALRIQEHHYGATSYKQMGDLLLSYQQLLDAISYYEKALDTGLEASEIHHNLACCYRIRGDIEKAGTCYQLSISLSPTSGSLAEYSHFLIRQERFQESLPFIEQCLQAVIDVSLGYGMAQSPTVLPAIQGLINKHPSHSIKLSAQGLAHYLQVLCYQMCQQKEQAQKAMQHFEMWIAQQPDFQQQETFQSLKNSLALEAESITSNLLSLEQQLFEAVKAGDLNVVQAIIEKQDFSIDWQETHYQRTVLHLACISHQGDTIAYLLSKMARFDIKDKEEKLAWEYVINTPLLDLFKTTSALFTQKYAAAVNIGIFLDWEKVLQIAVSNNYFADVRFLIEVKRIDSNSVDANPKTAYTALHLAVIKNNPEIVNYLVSKGANTNALDASKKTPLDYIKPEQKELLTLFKLSVRGAAAKELGFSFEKLHL